MHASTAAGQHNPAERVTAQTFLVIARDIARGGLAGLMTGILVAGIGGRVVMRLAALLVPEATGLVTENGNRIGEITIEGTIALILLAGLFFGLSGAVVWIVVAPWIPLSSPGRALLAGPIAVALTGIALIDGFNHDFASLRYHPAVVALLLLLVALVGASMAWFDTWLETRLPRPGASRGADSAFLLITLAGGLLIVPLVLTAYLGGHDRPLGFALVGVGLATLLAWGYRVRGVGNPWWLTVVGRGALLLAVVLGFLALAPDVSKAVHWR